MKSEDGDNPGGIVARLPTAECKTWPPAFTKCHTDVSRYKEIKPLKMREFMWWSVGAICGEVCVIQCPSWSKSSPSRATRDRFATDPLPVTP